MSTAEWFESVAGRAGKYIQDPADRELLTPETYDLIRDPHYPRMEAQGIFGDYVETEAFQALAERFIKAWELIGAMEDNANFTESPDSCRFTWLCEMREPAEKRGPEVGE